MKFMKCFIFMVITGLCPLFKAINDGFDMVKEIIEIIKHEI